MRDGCGGRGRARTAGADGCLSRRAVGTMTAMKRAHYIVALGLIGCGPAGSGEHVKTPDELVAEQEAIQASNEKESKARGTDDYVSSEATDSEKAKAFDEKHTTMELQRATRSAESCPGVVAGQEGKSKPRGEATVTITFQEDGKVKSAAIASPFDGTPVGECAVRAFKSVITTRYVGGDHIMDWKINLADPPPGAKTEAAPKK